MHVRQNSIAWWAGILLPTAAAVTMAVGYAYWVLKTGEWLLKWLM